MKRLYISYRGTDGRKIADRLAQALIQRFGTEQIAHHPRTPQDVHSWHDELLQALGRQPRVLVVVTPDLFGARSDSGQVCVDDPDDPVRRELESALLTRATLIPLLTDQVLMPDGAYLPMSLRPFAECQPLHLHSSHWSEDLERLCSELQSTGLTPPLGGVHPPHAGPHALPLAGLVLASFSLLGVLMVVSRDIPPGAPPTAEQVLAQHDAPLDNALAPTAAGQSSLSGDWIATLADGSKLPFTVRQTGPHVSMSTPRLPMATDPLAQRIAAWALPQPDDQITDLRLHAEGTLNGSALELFLTLETGDGRFVIDKGDLELLISDDQQGMSGGMHFSKSSPTAIALQRP